MTLESSLYLAELSEPRSTHLAALRIEWDVLNMELNKISGTKSMLIFHEFFYLRQKSCDPGAFPIWRTSDHTDLPKCPHIRSWQALALPLQDKGCGVLRRSRKERPFGELTTDGRVCEQAQIYVTQGCLTGLLALPSVPNGCWWFIVSCIHTTGSVPHQRRWQRWKRFTGGFWAADSSSGGGFLLVSRALSSLL